MTTCALTGAIITFALTGSGFAQTTTWLYGASNNSANFGVTADNSQAITWQDGWGGGTAPNTARFGSESLTTNRPSQFGISQGVLLYGFGGTGMSSANVSAAQLYLRQDFSSLSQTWNIVGLATGNANWDTSTMTFNDIDGAGVDDWTGGTLAGSTLGNYGSFNTSNGGGIGVDTNISVDITNAFKAYLDGTIVGIAFVNNTNGLTPTAGDNRFQPYSNENTTATNRPGLLVTTVPEPSSALLGGLGVLLLLRRRR